MLKIITPLIKYSDWLILFIFGLFIVCTSLIKYEADFTWGDCLRISLEILMGDSPQNLNIPSPQISNLSLVMLYMLRFLGWLLLPVLIGIIVSNGQEKLAQDVMAPLVEEIDRQKGKETVYLSALAILTDTLGEQEAEERLNSFMEALKSAKSTGSNNH